MPLIRRVPKRGFTNIFRKRWAVVNVRDLAVFPKDAEVTPEVLRERRLVPNLRLYEGVKILGVGKIGTALIVRAHAFSAGARAKIEKAGGRAEVIPRA
jgi:large subunit ribosomal protein L15